MPGCYSSRWTRPWSASRTPSMRLGYLLSPGGFFDITTGEQLKRITPANLLDPPTKGNAARPAYTACLKWFPEICRHWSANRELVAQIIEYHDATKHRHSAVVGQALGRHLLKPAPKQAMVNVAFNKWSLVAHNEEESLQSITAGYHTFMTKWLRIAGRFEVVFGQPLPAPQS